MEQNIKTHREIHPSITTSPVSRPGVWAAGTYLAVCGALSIYSILALGGPGAHLSGVIPYLVSAPWSLIPLGVLETGSDSAVSKLIFIALPVIGALINAVVIHGLAGRLSSVVPRSSLRCIGH